MLSIGHALCRRHSLCKQRPLQAILSLQIILSTNHTVYKSYSLQIILSTNHTVYKSYSLQIILSTKTAHNLSPALARAYSSFLVVFWGRVDILDCFPGCSISPSRIDLSLSDLSIEGGQSFVVYRVAIRVDRYIMSWGRPQSTSSFVLVASSAWALLKSIWFSPTPTFSSLF
jgi:hypothetical protein